MQVLFKSSQRGQPLGQHADVGRVELRISRSQKKSQTAVEHCDVEVRGDQLLELRLHRIGFLIFLPFGGKDRFKKFQDEMC